MIDTQNDFLIGSNGSEIVPFMPIVITSREQAYRTAAWIKTMAVILPAEEGHTYDEIEEAIQNT